MKKIVIRFNAPVLLTFEMCIRDRCINTTKRFVKDIVPAIAKFCEDWFNSHG